MKQVYRINELGEYVEPVILQDGEAIPLDCVEVIPTEGLFKAKWDGTTWVESATIDHLGIAKEKKIAELNNLCRETILNGYAIGTYEYENELHDQRNLALKGLKVLMDTNITSVAHKTKNAGVVTHTRDEFLNVVKAADTHIETNLTKYRDLKTKVKNALTVADIEAIIW
jgi:hypothetical protein